MTDVPTDLSLTIYTSADEFAEPTLDEVIDFLFHSLEQYGDPRDHIMKCADYAFSKGGFIITAMLEGKLVGVSIINDTGMGGYIPEHILVYIATDAAMRGKGIGKQLMSAIVERCEGDIALHVEPDNPAAHLYRKIGFTSKYLEMRYKK